MIRRLARCGPRLRWQKRPAPVQRPGVTAPIIGARTLEQLEQNLGAVGWSLSHEEHARLDEASALPLPSPYDFIERYTRRRDENAVYALR